MSDSGKPHRPWMVMLDGDDTCWYCRHNYFIADWACGLIIARELGIHAPPPTEVLLLIKKIERGKMAELGFRLDQFEEAWVAAYHQLCEQAGVRVNNRTERELWHEASYVKRAAYPAIPEIYGVLRHLRVMASSVNLVSLGDRAFQMQKVEKIGLTGFFDSKHITQGDKGLVMQELAAEGCRAVMVGDSLHSDIEPAMALGLAVVWIHNNSPWAQSENELDPRVHVIHHIEELPDLFRQIISR